MASNSGWTTGLPSGTSKVSDGDAEFRSLKSYVEAWIEEEHYATGGSAASAGVHRLGSARVFVGTTSQLSNPTGDNDGRLMFTSDNTGLYVAHGSASTWKLVTNDINLGSQHTWTAPQEFTSGISASGIALGGVFNGIKSVSSVMAQDVGIADGVSGTIIITETNNQFTPGDVFLPASATSIIGAVNPTVYMNAGFLRSDYSQIRVSALNDAGSRVTIPAGARVTVIGFQNPLT